MKRLLLPFVLAALVSVAVPTSAPAAANGGCALTPKKPKIADEGRVVFKGSVRCRRTVRRAVDFDHMAVLASGKVRGMNGYGEQWTFRARKRYTWSAALPCVAMVERYTRIFDGDAPQKVFLRMRLTGPDDGKRLKRKDSVRVPVAELCPDAQSPDEGAPAPGS
jgi:hypothetical protein